MNKDRNKISHLQKALTEDARYDDRVKDQFRDIQIETDVIATAEGSARITAGDTVILAGVKLSMGTPYPDSPDEGVLMVNCELLPIAHPTIESGPPSIDAIEISRVIDRGIRESHTVDAKKLCIEAGEKVWMVTIDIVPLNHDGNIIDLGALAAVKALQNTKFPNLVDGKADYKDLTKEKLDVLQKPVPVTVCKVGDQIFVDPLKAEENELDARLTITVLEDDKICSLQKGGEKGFTADELSTAFDMAISSAKKLRKHLK